ncbi:cytochrome P450, partial [Streptomyces sp. K1PA1]|nr:cytochrome P450 [Streptomyces tropicalis]
MSAPSSSLPLFDDRVLADPYPSYGGLRGSGAAVLLEEYGVWAIPRHADIAAILKNPDVFASEGG